LHGRQDWETDLKHVCKTFAKMSVKHLQKVLDETGSL
jgi:hypothetical protein